MLVFFGGGQPEPEQTVNQFNNPTFGTQAIDAARMAYHAEVQKLEKERLEIRAMLEGKDVVELQTGQYELQDVILEDGTKAKPFCRHGGRRAIMNFVNERLNPNTILSYYSKTRIYVLLMDDHKYLHALCHNNLRRWKIDVLEWEAVHYSIMGMIESAYRRAMDGRERTWVASIFNTIQTIQGRSGDDQPKGGLSRLFSGGK